MQEVVASFTTVMTWLILLMSSIAVVLLGLAAWHLPAHRCRALVGVLGMALVLAATAVSLLLLAAHHPHNAAPCSANCCFRWWLPCSCSASTASRFHRSIPHRLPASPGCGSSSCSC